MEFNRKKTKIPDIILIAFVSLIILYGLLALNQATLWAGPSYLLKQIIWIGVGIVVMFIVTFLLRLNTVIAFSYLFYLLTLIFLLIPWIPGLSSGEAHRWVDFRIFKAQPSDFAKLSLIFVLARYLTDRYTFWDMLKRFFYRWRIGEKQPLLIPALQRRKIGDPIIIAEVILITIIPFLLILAEPDLGTSIVFIFILLSMLYFAGLNLATVLYLVTPGLSIFLSIFLVTSSYDRTGWILVVLLFLLLLVSFFIYKKNTITIIVVLCINVFMIASGPMIWNYVLKEYQKKRIITFMDPSADPTGSGWHILQSKIAIGSGKLWGEGMLNLETKELAFLPEQHTDFIFSVIAKKGGFIGATILLLLYLLFLRRIFLLSKKTKNSSYSLVTIGIGTLFTFQIIVNISMTLGALPVVGIALPFISYGGSSMLMSFTLLGFLLNISRSAK